MVRPVTVSRVLLLLSFVVPLASARGGALRPMSRELLDARQRFAAARREFVARTRGTEGNGGSASPAAQAPVPRLDAWQGNGVPVSTDTIGQGNPQICTDDAGGAFVGWWDLRNGFGDVFANRLDATGSFPAGWTGAGVNLDPVDSLELFVEVVPDGAGGMLAAFSHFDPGAGTFHDVTIQRLTASGARAAGYPAAGKTLAFPGLNGLVVRSDRAGGLFLAVADAAEDVWLLHLDGDASPVGGWPASGVPLGTLGAISFDVAPAGGGAAYVARTSGDSVLCMRFDAGGSISSGWPGSGVQVNGGGTTLGAIAVGTLTGGDAMVAWEDDRSGDVDLYAVRVDAAGSLPAPWAVDGVAVNTVPGLTYVQGVAPDAAGGATIVWEDQTDEGGGIAPGALRLDANGVPVAGWPAQGLLLSPPSTSKSDAAVIGDGAGGVFGTWVVDAPAANPGVYLQYLQADGTRPGSFAPEGVRVCSAPGGKLSPALAPDGTGGVILAWEDLRAIRPRVYAAHVHSDGTVPAQLALVDATARPGRVRLHWFDPAGPFAASLVRETANAAPLVTPVHSDGTGDLVYEDTAVTAGAEYRYVLRDGGGAALAPAVTVRVPAGPVLAIEAARPNPSAGRATLAFSLASASPARLELIDVAGRRVLARDLAGLEAGGHVLPLATRLAPGVYTARLVQSGAVVTTRLVVAP